MATKYDAIQNRINMQATRHEQDISNAESMLENAYKIGTEIVDAVGSQIGTQQAQDWLKARQTAYEEADANGDFLKDANGNTLTDFNDIQKRRDEWLETYSINNPAPKNKWAQKAIDNATSTGTELSDAKLATSAIKQLQKQQNDLIADNEESIIGTSISNPASYNETLLANYGAKYDSLDDTQKGWYDDGSEMGSKRLALSLMYNANGINKNNSDFRIAVLNDDIENSYWLDNWASAYQANCLDSNAMTDEQFWEKWENEANNESLKPSKGYFDSSRKDYIKKQLEAKTRSLLNAKKESVGNLYNSQAVPAINGMYEASKNSPEGAGFRYPNTETIDEILGNLGIDSRFLPDEVNTGLDKMRKSGDAVSACINAVHMLNDISASDMPEEDKVAEFIKYKATLSPSTISNIEAMADLDPYYGKYSQMTDVDIYEHMNKLASPLIEKANMSDGPIIDAEANRNALIENNKDTFIKERSIIDNYDDTKVMTPDVQALIDKEKESYPDLADASDSAVLAHIDVRLGNDEIALRNAGVKAEEISTATKAMKSAIGRISEEAINDVTSVDTVESMAKLYIAFGASDSSVLESGLVSSLKQGYMEAHISEIEEYARDTGRDFDNVLDELFADYSRNIYSSAVDYFSEYGNTENDDLGMTPNEYLEEKQSVYSNLMDKMVVTGADGRSYFPKNGISTANLNESSKRWIEELNRGHINTANETQKKLMELDNKDQRLAFFNNIILPNSSLYTEEEVDRWRGIANGDYGNLLTDNGIKISDYISMLGSADSRSNAPIRNMIEYEIGALVPAYYKNGQFDKTGFNNAANKKAISIIGTYADSVYFKDNVKFNLSQKANDKRKELLKYIGSPTEDIPTETVNYTNEIISNAAEGNINNALSILLANSTIVPADTRSLLSKSFDAITLTRMKSLTDEDRKGYAMEGILTDLGFSFNHSYTPDGDNSDFWETSYGYISELGTSSRNLILSAVNNLYTISAETSDIEKAGMSLGSKSANDNSYISEDRKTSYIPVYDANGNVSFDVYSNGSGDKIGNTKYISEASLERLSREISKSVAPSFNNNIFNEDGIPVGRSSGIVGPSFLSGNKAYSKQLSMNLDAFLKNKSGDAYRKFNAVNQIYKATHNGVGLKLVISNAPGSVIKIIEDKEKN